MRRRVAATRSPDGETVERRLARRSARRCRNSPATGRRTTNGADAKPTLNSLPNFLTEIDGLDIHFIHVRSQHEDAPPLIVTHGWPGSISEQLNHRTAHQPDGTRGRRGRTLSIPSSRPLPGHRFSASHHHRLGSGPHRPSLGRADEATRLQPVRGPRRRLGSPSRSRWGSAGRAGAARDALQHARHRATGHRPATCVASRRRTGLSDEERRAATSPAPSTRSTSPTPRSWRPAPRRCTAWPTRRSISPRSLTDHGDGTGQPGLIAQTLDGSLAGRPRPKTTSSTTSRCTG